MNYTIFHCALHKITQSHAINSKTYQNQLSLFIAFSKIFVRCFVAAPTVQWASHKTLADCDHEHCTHSLSITFARIRLEILFDLRFGHCVIGDSTQNVCTLLFLSILHSFDSFISFEQRFTSFIQTRAHTALSRRAIAITIMVTKQSVCSNKFRFFLVGWDRKINWLSRKIHRRIWRDHQKECFSRVIWPATIYLFVIVDRVAATAFAVQPANEWRGTENCFMPINSPIGYWHFVGCAQRSTSQVSGVSEATEIDNEKQQWF